jgi:hypothetical protein
MNEPAEHPEITGEVAVCAEQPCSVFSTVSADVLRDDAALLRWFRTATSQRRPVIRASEMNLLRVFSAAERALEVGRNPPALFASIVSHARWELISCAQEDRAVARLKASMRGEPRQRKSRLPDHDPIPIRVLVEHLVENLLGAPQC